MEVERGHSKNTSPKNQLFFDPLRSCNFLSLIFQTLSQLFTDQNSDKVFPDKPSLKVFWVRYCVCLLHNTPYPISTSEQLNKKTYLIFTSWKQTTVKQQSETKCYIKLM